MSRCQQNQKCQTSATFNVKGSKKPVFCKQHAEDGMVDARNKRCSKGSCKRQPTFNVEGSKTPAYCKQHAKDGMVSGLGCAHNTAA